MKPERPEAAIFDLDGTLFQAETLMIPAYYAAFDHMRREGDYSQDTPPVERLLGGLGMVLSDIWERILPGESVELHHRANDLLLRYQKELLDQGEGLLYPGVAEVLERLREKGARLFIASNGMEHYVKSVAKAKGIDHYFEGLYSAGEFNTPSKVELVRLLMLTEGVSGGWMVGDRSSDVEAGRGNGLRVMGCRYAEFGQASELEGADAVISDIRQLPDYLL
ncbi:HAD family hydrolase [Paenibacillus sp. J2TS4]|uniref:HAD family hydrolase n=1 Tax=Paenibacillus sp. J2TS4 TaxID=2807194 RepID=UPI001BCE397E|nr:HAD family hydrolase [Paenibacillus sp. J2TS4]